ncbi:MAG: hypothetical protein EXR71_18010 [Myxococcales bacterium]|nr:hypothetical protein [Myxococcales bacterium]
MLPPTLALLSLAACTAAPDTSGGGSQSAAAGEDALYVAHTDEGTVSRFDLEFGTIDNLELGGEPTRIVALGDRLLVTLRAERSIAVLQDLDDQLTLVERAETGSEPLGLVASADGERVYVALSTQDEVHELDGDLSLVRVISVPGRPSWLALHPSGDSLYVSAAVGGTVSYIDTTDPEAAPVSIEFPTLLGAGKQMDQPYARRLTGDPAFNPAGEQLAIPGLWVDDVSVPGGNHGEEGHDPAERYEKLGLGLSPNNPGIALLDVDSRGAPLGGVGPIVYAEGYAATDDPAAPMVVRSYLASASYSADGDLLFGTMETSEHVIVLGSRAEDLREGPGGFSTSPTVLVRTGAGPRAVALDPDGNPWVHLFLDRAVARIDLSVIEPLIDAQIASGEAAKAMITAEAAVELAHATLAPTIAEGRALFYAATNPTVVTPAAGLSCSACHFEGRNDGMTWPVDSGIRQTPSFAGPVSLTAPFTWTEGVATLTEEARITSQERLGGVGITDAQLAAIAAFLDYTRDVDHPHKGEVTAATGRGLALFNRADVGCAGCHNGPRMTDLLPHDMFGLDSVDTPSLIGIAATVPYLHDGRAESLRAVLDEARSGAMGDTSSLSEAELDDLEAYLNSL